MGQSSFMTPEQYVQQKAAASGSSFYYAFLFLPPARRAAITAFYAFCREVDDVVDEVSDAGVARTKLAWWQAEVARSFAGQPPAHPVMQALMPHTGMYGIEERHLQAVIEGCQMDLEQTRYLDFQGLSRYCHLVAGIVGEVAARIFGPSDERTVEYAHTLGLAFQLTNIIRDVGEDAMMGRIYLPVAELQQFDVKAHEILKRQYSDRFTALMRFQAERAHGLYDKALSLLPGDQRRAQKPGLMMASIYRTLLREIERDQFQVLHQRIALTPLRKLWLAWKMQALGRM
ncbi:farnesyl-diphosphate farnesyltransferase [Paracidovorax citrulli]|uniref:Farnesyl-diphosphate farnesyltransferase n=2 Tax=Paracidovorax citrulli TaxID=80869 RepID=A1TM59_PARC0|nr:farnesyl-diphosphate farnesyltransferase [Paracidovorax citrulli AAC00-1]PVY66236.1 farnesyl-diphosphate farnesyltransferase [Paracidovorax citrulli]QCX11975.1 All-trans-phytoene synthase [Paracidovorax citrulli]REG69591.1 farnesyl-diphosphate farnesyltransferase [Paracidovorax citrulli]RLJ94145.1 farnesyl-diphosphate farnesyltransferase [Paracidovorax citrulli]